MSKEITISYIIPAYNSEATIEQCIQHIKKQKFGKEILVVNDGSKDKTKEICTKQGAKVVTIPNSGASVARNVGIKLAGGDYIALIDADSYLNTDWAEKVMKNDTKKWDFVITFPKLDPNNYNKIIKRFESDPKVTLDKIVAFGNGVFFNAKNKHLAIYNENFIVGGEDWEIIIRLLKNGAKIMADPNPKFKHKHQFSSQTKRIMTFIKKKFLFSYGDLYCAIKYRDVKPIRGFFRTNAWITPFFPFIYGYIKLNRALKHRKINFVMKEYILNKE